MEIRAASVVVDGVRAGREELPADAVFLLTGYHPDARLLREAGVRVDEATLMPAHDPETLETNVPGLFVAGRARSRAARRAASSSRTAASTARRS